MSNDLATTGNNLPTHLQVDAGSSGFIDDDSALMAPPRITLIQKSSSAFDEGLGQVGQFLNSSTQDAVDELIFTPIKGHHDYIVFDGEGNIEFQSESEAEARQTLGEEYWKAKRMNIVLLPYGKSIPAVYSFKGTAYKTGTKLYQLCKVANHNCMFSRAYKLTAEERQGAGGKYFVPLVGLAPNVDGYSDENAWLTAEAFEVAKIVAEQL